MKKLIFLVLIIYTGIASAGDTKGTVGLLYVHNHDANVLFNMVSTNKNFVSCATSSRYAIDTSTQQGRNNYTALLAAKAAAKTIFIKGNNECNTNIGAETVRWMYIEKSFLFHRVPSNE